MLKIDHTLEMWIHYQFHSIRKVCRRLFYVSKTVLGVWGKQDMRGMFFQGIGAESYPIASCDFSQGDKETFVFSLQQDRMAVDHRSQSKCTLVGKVVRFLWVTRLKANAPGSPGVADGQLYQWRVPLTEQTTCKGLHYWEVPWERPSPTVPPSPRPLFPLTLRNLSRTGPMKKIPDTSGILWLHESCVLSVKNLMGLVILLSHTVLLYKAVLMVRIWWGSPGGNHCFWFKTNLNWP